MLKYNLKRENQVILLMIINGKNWHYLPVKKFSTLLRGITSYSTKDKLKKHKDLCKSHDHCYIGMPKEDNRVLKYDHGEKSM